MLALTKALERLIGDPVLRRKLGHAGNKVVRTSFSLEANIQPLIEKFEDDLGAPHR